MATSGQQLMKISAANSKILSEALTAAAEKVDDLRFPLGEISRDFYKSEKAIFQLGSAGGYDDFKNKKSRAQKLKAVGFEYPLLKRSGRLEKSITGPSARGSINLIGRKNLVIGTSIKYGAYHQYGTKNMSQRPFVFIGPESKEFAADEQFSGRITRWTNIIERYVEAVLKAQGFSVGRK